MSDKKTDSKKRGVLKLSGSVDMSRIMAARQAKSRAGVQVEIRGPSSPFAQDKPPVEPRRIEVKRAAPSQSKKAQPPKNSDVNKREIEARRAALSAAADFFVQADKGRADLAGKNVGVVEAPPVPEKPKKPEKPAESSASQPSQPKVHNPRALAKKGERQDGRKKFEDGNKSWDNQRNNRQSPYPSRRGGSFSRSGFGNRPPHNSALSAPVPGRASLKGQRLQKRLVPPPPIKYVVKVANEMTVDEVARCIAVKGRKVVHWLRDMGVKAGGGTVLDQETVMMVIEGMGHEAVVAQVSEKDLLEEKLGTQPENTEQRPPVLAIMGHVDHGKTTLVDALCDTRQTAKEAGGITQDVKGYRTELYDGHMMTLIDTPGHEAFSGIRERGAEIVDMILLIVAADDGPKPQTVESLDYLKKNNLPFIVVVTKVDKPHDMNKVINELMRYEVVPESMGGSAVFVEISAEKGTNMDALREMIALKSSEIDLGCNAKGWLSGMVLDASVTKGQGVVVQVLIQNGTLCPGQYIVADKVGARVRAMTDSMGKPVKAALPSDVVTISGLSEVPAAGAFVVGVKDANHMKTIIDARMDHTPAKVEPRKEMFEWDSHTRQTELSIIVRADAHGSIEALRWVLDKLTCEEWSVRVIQAEVGDIADSTLDFAKTSGSLIVGFNVAFARSVEQQAAKSGVTVVRSKVVYDIEKAVYEHLRNLCAPKYEDVTLGFGQVIQVFDIHKVGRVAGCAVKEGRICVGMLARVTRGDVELCTQKIVSLRREKDTMKEVGVGFNCGIFLESFQEFEMGDRIECFERKVVAIG